jgi:hypothetical protein
LLVAWCNFFLLAAQIFIVFFSLLPLICFMFCKRYFLKIKFIAVKRVLLFCIYRRPECCVLSCMSMSKLYTKSFYTVQTKFQGYNANCVLRKLKVWLCPTSAPTKQNYKIKIKTKTWSLFWNKIEQATLKSFVITLITQKWHHISFRNKKVRPSRSLYPSNNNPNQLFMIHEQG